MPLVVDTDVGFDDLLALALLVARGRAPTAVTTCFGMSAVAAGTRRVAAFCAALGIAPQIVGGAAEPLTDAARGRCLTSFPWGKAYRAKFAEVADLVGDATDRDPAPSTDPGAAAAGGRGNLAAKALVDIARGAESGSLDLLLLGPLTNVAEALQLDVGGDLARAVRRCVVMGGAIHVPGNSGDNAEFNFWKDPQAAAAVLRSPLPVELVGLEVARPEALTSEQRARVAGGRGVISRLLATMPDAADYDPVAAARLLEPDLFEVDAACSAAICGTTGQMRPLLREGSDAAGWAPLRVTLCTGMHRDRYAALLDAAAGTGPPGSAAGGGGAA